MPKWKAGAFSLCSGGTWWLAVDRLADATRWCRSGARGGRERQHGEAGGSNEREVTRVLIGGALDACQSEPTRREADAAAFESWCHSGGR
mmetsp:Transcript_82075/g.232408  ORF Transcript_82075/g.232408 Transcript_82075/m.232408 type:complete len:90 (-) Transcript_82075:25-294(-)